MTDMPLKSLFSAGGFPQSKSFIDRLCPLITEDMLAEIARADYGTGFEDHLQALRRLRDRDISDQPMAWEPQEVLNLFRWSEFGDDRTGREQRTEQAFHLMRAFCCALILEASVTPANHEEFVGNNQTLIQLLESARVLGPDDEARLPAFIAWLIPRAPAFEDEVGFYGIAFVSTVVRHGRKADDDANFLIKVIDACEAEFEKLLITWTDPVNNNGDRWLLGWTHFNQRHGKWEQLGRQLSIEAENIEQEQLRKRLKRLSSWLTVDGAWRQS